MTLQGSIDRQSRTESNLQTRQFEWVWGESPSGVAVQTAYESGRVAPSFPCFRCGKSNCLRSDCNNVLIPSQIATWFSHMKAWKRIVDRGTAGLTLILEDDFALAGYANQSGYFNSLRSVLSEFSPSSPMLLRLGRKKDRLSGHKDGPLHLTTRVTMSNPAYALNEMAAKILLESIPQTFSHTVDVWLHRETSRMIESRTVEPPAFFELSSSDVANRETSLIHPKKPRISSLVQRNAGFQVYLNSHRAWRSHQNSRIDLELLATGLPRSGSKFVSLALGVTGKKIGHEQLGRDGISSWMFASDAWEVPFGKGFARFPRLFHFEQVIHYLRDPLEVLASLVRDFRYSPAVGFMERNLQLKGLWTWGQPRNEVERAAAVYVGWNQLVEEKFPRAHRVRVEEVGPDLANIFPSLSRRKIAALQSLPPQNVNKQYKGVRYPKPLITVSDITELVHDELLSSLLEQSREYGYPLD